jgi:hypothetical protein
MSSRFVAARRAACAAVLMLLLAAQAAVAAEFRTQSLPVPVSIEGERVRTSLLLQFELERYGVPFNSFATGGNLDASEIAFRDFVLALRAGDAARVAALLPGGKPEEGREMVSRFGAAFSGSQVVKVVARVRVGEGQLFVWEWPAPKGPVRRGFLVSAPAQGTPTVSMVSSALPLHTLIVDTLQQEALHPRDYAPVEPRTRYHYAFPLAGHPVVLHFDGQPLNVEMFTADAAKAARQQSEAVQSAAAPTLAAAAYRAAYFSLKERDPKRFPDSYTDKSREKLRAWMERMRPEEYDSFLVQATQPRTLRFMIDADPVVLVFYTIGDEKRLRYEYLLKVGDAYKLTNAYYEGFLDDVIGNGVLFPTELASFRKSVLVAGGAQQ